jgi:hypothetical protein
MEWMGYLHHGIGDFPVMGTGDAMTCDRIHEDTT